MNIKTGVLDAMRADIAAAAENANQFDRFGWDFVLFTKLGRSLIPKHFPSGLDHTDEVSLMNYLWAVEGHAHVIP